MSQLETAFEVFLIDHENMEKLFRTGKLRLDADPTYILYLYYMGGVSFYDITHSFYYSENQRKIAKKFMELEQILIKQKK